MTYFSEFLLFCSPIRPMNSPKNVYPEELMSTCHWVHWLVKTGSTLELFRLCPYAYGRHLTPIFEKPNLLFREPRILFNKPSISIEEPSNYINKFNTSVSNSDFNWINKVFKLKKIFFDLLTEKPFFH